MFLDKAKGGYAHLYDILDGDKVIGAKSVSADTRNSPVKVEYALGDLVFDNAKDFIAAYEAQKGAAHD